MERASYHPHPLAPAKAEFNIFNMKMVKFEFGNNPKM
jgi:hypothetical protein